MVHGDDCVTAGRPEALNWLEVQLADAYDIRTQKIRGCKGFEPEGKVLNRIIRCDELGW